MRVIAGEFRGRRLQTPVGETTRPTSDRVRESLFGTLGEIRGATVLDLFAGSGALGIEALSRGASHATFVERDPKALRALRANLDVLGLTVRSRVLRRDARSLDRLPGPYGIVFCDPPYRDSISEEFLEQLTAVTIPGATFVLERSSDSSPPAPDSLWELARDRRYGGTSLTIYRRQEEEVG